MKYKENKTSIKKEKTVKEFMSYMMTVLFTKDKNLMEKEMVKVNSFIKMEEYMMEIGIRIKFMVQEYFTIILEK